MWSGRPIVAFADVAEGLVDGESARLLDTRTPPQGVAAALRELHADPALAAALAAGARQRLRTHHDWTELASSTLALCGDVSTR